MNNICLVGHLSKTPELRYIPSDGADEPKAVVTFTVAVNDRIAREKRTDFIRCEAWGGIAKVIGENFKNGDPIGVVGRLRLDSVKGNDGTYKNYTKVIVEKFDFLSSKKSKLENEFTAVNDDEIPF